MWPALAKSARAINGLRSLQPRDHTHIFYWSRSLITISHELYTSRFLIILYPLTLDLIFLHLQHLQSCLVVLSLWQGQ